MTGFPFGFSVAYTYHCSLCDRTGTSGYRQRPGDELLLPGLPSGWRAIAHLTVCDLHEVELVVTTPTQAAKVTFTL